MRATSLKIIIIICGWLSVFVSYDSLAIIAGTSKIEITPELGVPLNGYGARFGRGAISKHDPLWAHALYISDGETEVILVSLDLCVVDRTLRERLLTLLPEDFPKENLILTATHTHNGFGGMEPNYPIRFVSGRYIPELVESTAKKISETIRVARENKKPAVIGYGVIHQQDLTCNRRYSGGPFDPQIGIIAVQDSSGNDVAVIANMAGHPTSIGEEDFYSFSADYPGFYYLEIETLSSGRCVPFFLNGAEGNQTIQAPEGTSGWARTEKVGRLLAQKVWEAKKNLVYKDARIKLVTRRVQTPPSIAEFMPRETILQALIINDLAISFFPGELCVEFALKLREHAIGGGYNYHFTVGLANDYLLYFVPVSLLFDRTYEAGMNFYGTQAEKWVLKECLETLGIHYGETDSSGVGETNQLSNGVKLLKISGSAYERGVQRGIFTKEIIEKRFEELISRPVSEGKYVPQSGLFSFIPYSILDASNLLIPFIAISVRPWAGKLKEELRSEVIGISDGAGLPFDKVWLLQNAINIRTARDYSPLFNTPLCTAVGIFGERAGASDLLLAHTVDWDLDELPLVIFHSPANGLRFLEVGFPWFAGLLSGMNEAGIVVSVTKEIKDGIPLHEESPPLEMTLKSILGAVSKFEEAQEEIRKCKIPDGYHILLGGKRNDNKWTATVFPEELKESGQEKGIVLGCGSLNLASETAQLRYTALIKRIGEERIVSVDELKQFITLRVSGDSQANIWNVSSRFSVVFEPNAKKLWVAIRGENGEPTEFESVTIE
ncbi:MAG: neutral/alkaline non-lysosomal ceramidase N-terminal domain-containing protein [Candidatus Hydrogenedentes bacterium]|nr:neutral/alkaline non-lysosomal ceramidase N-terminal domain-containing protein [Candidatus Hydrogenedentota bacterium]